MYTKLEEEIEQTFIEVLAKGNEIDEDTLHELFYEGYWVIGYLKAEKEILKHCSIFQAIGKIQDYENDHFGEVSTDLSDSVSVANMLVYILAEEIGVEKFNLRN